MEINKQLFEDVLSGKLKGKFVLRDGSTFDSKYLKRTKDTSLVLVFRPHYPYALINDSILASYTENGDWNIMEKNSCIDIVDFIPNTNMNENELTIEIPEGKIVDWEESKRQNKIVLKNKQLTYENVCKKVLEDDFYFIGGNGVIGRGTGNSGYAPNCAKTKHQLECILAKNKLTNVALYLNDGWKPNKPTSGSSDQMNAYTLDFDSDSNIVEPSRINTKWALYGQVLFKTKELALQAIEILGKETVKLALEPLGYE